MRDCFQRLLREDARYLSHVLHLQCTYVLGDSYAFRANDACLHSLPEGTGKFFEKFLCRADLKAHSQHPILLPSRCRQIRTDTPR